MRRIVILCLVFMLIGAVGLAAEPQEDIEITIEGKKVELDVPPRMQEGRTLVPARFMFEPLGATMEWDGENEIASGILGDQRVDMPIGSKEAKVNGEIEILDVPAQVFEGRTYIPLRFAGEAFGRNVLWDGTARTITVGEADIMELLYTEERWGEISELCFAPDNDTIAVGEREVDLFSVANREVFASGSDMDYGDRPESNSLDFSPDGSLLAAASRGVSLHDANNLTKLLDLHGGGDCRATFSPDGEMLATHPSQMDSEVWLWKKVNDAEFEKVTEFAPDGNMIHDIAFSPDGALVAGGFRDGIVRLWDVQTHELVNTIDFDTSGGHYNLTFSPDGKMLAASDPDLASEFYLFDTEDFSRIEVFEPEGRVSRMQFSPDGSKLAYGLHGGGVEVLDTGNWSLLYSFEQDNTVRGLSFSPDSRKLAIGTGDGNLYLYGYK